MEVSDDISFVFTTQAVAILQQKACGCRAGNVINLAAASKWFSARMQPEVAAGTVFVTIQGFSLVVCDVFR